MIIESITVCVIIILIFRTEIHKAQLQIFKVQVSINLSLSVVSRQ